MTYRVLASTENMSREDWLALRGNAIGGSDAGTIAGINPWKSKFTLWAEKTGRIKVEFKGNQATQWGHDLEEIVAKRYAINQNRAVVQWAVTLESTRWQFMRANLDYLIVEPSEQYPSGEITKHTGDSLPPNTKAILEIKTAGIVGASATDKWANDKVPEMYEWQGCHYSAVTGIPRVVFAALVAGEGLVVRGRFFEEDDLQNLVNVELDFWEAIERNEPPEVDGARNTSETISRMYPVSTPLVKAKADESLAKAFWEYVRIKDEASALETKMRELRNQLELAIGDAEALEYNGTTLFTYKVTKSGEAIDIKALAEAYPEIAQEFTKPKSGYRVLRPNKER